MHIPNTKNMAPHQMLKEDHYHPAAKQFLQVHRQTVTEIINSGSPEQADKCFHTCSITL